MIPRDRELKKVETADHRTGWDELQMAKSGCLICGKELVYLKTSEKMNCFFCKERYDSRGRCVNGHFVCDVCHSLPANDLIERFCINSDSVAPLEMTFTLMRNPQVKMHGPEHHFLVPAVLLASYYNMRKDYRKKEEKIKEARKRAEKILGGFCGSHGNCGAAVGTGIFVSLITEATPLSKHEWKMSNLMTSRSLHSIAGIGGPRCCKRVTFLSIIEAKNFLEEELKVQINPKKKIVCEFNSLNKECKKNECPFYTKQI